MACLLPLLLLLSLLPVPIPAQGPGFWSIDCGGSEAFTDKNNLTWVGDGPYVRGGRSRAVTTTAATLGLGRELATLREFPSPSPSKNCYAIPASGKVLLRVWFLYGNYDGLSSPPLFNLIFDGTLWSPVKPPTDEPQAFEVIYNTGRRASISVCVARGEDGRPPFVSAIEVRALDAGMYDAVGDVHAVLYTMTRRAFGSTATIRYPIDAYDRVWKPTPPGYTLIRSSAPSPGAGARMPLDYPPAEVFLAAAAPPNGTADLIVHVQSLPSYSALVYFNMYFSEVADLSGTAHKRSFGVYLDAAPVSNASHPITPPYGGVLGFRDAGREASSATAFRLVPTRDSDLPPIMSALEVFWMDTAKNSTYDGDVEAVSLLQSNFKVLGKWLGDPCLPADYNWEWVNCSSDPSPRITRLHLSGYGLSGPLPDFSALHYLEIIDLHNNSLNGAVPDFLAKLPYLSVLNLAGNDFISLPKSLMNNAKIRMNISGNPHFDLVNSSRNNIRSSFSMYFAIFLIACIL